MALVSIIMNCYNGEKHLREAIDSVYAQTFTDWEIILWDDASTDSTADIAKCYDGKLRYFKNKKAASLGQARNWAIEQAMGEYIAFLDQDDIWFPRKLELQIPLFEVNKNVGIVYSDAIWFNDQTKVEWKSLKKEHKLRGNCFGDLLTNYLLTHSSVIIRKTALLEQDEWFDVRFNLLEEGDLFRRIAYNWELDFVDEPLTKWRIHHDSSTWRKYEELESEGIMLMSKFSSLYYNFDNMYKVQKKKYIAVMRRRGAISLWKKNRNNLARRHLVGHLLIDHKNIIIFIISIFPYSFFNQIQKIRNRIKI